MESVINKLAEIETAATKIMQARMSSRKSGLQNSMQIWKRKRQSGLKRSQQNFILLQMRIRKSSGTLPPNFYLHWTLITSRITEHCPHRFTKTL